MRQDSAKDKIMDASVTLFAKYGYKGTSTKQIAKEANVNELTIFRNFASKEGILLEIFACRLSLSDDFVAEYMSEFTYDVVTDLLAVSRLYHSRLQENIDLVMMIVKEFRAGKIFDLYVTLPKKFKTLLVGYLEELIRQGKLGIQDAELAAITFLTMNFGFFIMKSTFGDRITQITSEQYIDTSIRAYLESLRPQKVEGIGSVQSFEGEK